MTEINSEIVPIHTLSRKRATIANLVHQYVTIGLTIVNGIILVPLYLKYIDYKLYGAWLSTGSIIAWMGMVDAGLSEIIRQRTAQVFGARDFQNAGSVIGTSVMCNCVMGLFPLFIVLVGAPFLPDIFGIEGKHASSLSWSFILAGASVTMVIISGAASSVLQGLQQNIVMCFIYVITAVMGLFITVTMLIKGFGLISIPMGLFIRNTIAVFLYWGYLLTVACRRLNIRLTFSFAKFKEIASLASWTFLYKISFEVINQCDALVVGLVLGVETTPIFVLTKRVWDLLRMLMARVGVAFMPSLAHLHGEGDLSKFNRISARLLKTTNYLVIIGAALCLSLNHSFVNLWVGRDIYAGIGFDLIISTAILSTMFIWTINQILYAAGCIKGPAVVGVFQNLVRLALLLGLIYIWGLWGVIASITFSCIGVSLPYFLKKWSQILQSPYVELSREVMSFSVKAVILLFLAFVANRWLVVSTWTGFVTVTLGLAVVFGLLMLALDGQLRADVYSLASLIRKKIGLRNA